MIAWGAISFQTLPIDAYPDLSPPHVEIITQWPGHAAEEIERLISIPLEVEMNGIPKIEALRSISLYGLSALEMNFEYDIDPYFAREQAFERMANATLPSRSHARRFPSVQPQRIDLPLCAGQPGPHAARAEDHRGLGAGTPLSRHLRASPTIPAWAAPPCSIRCCSIPTGCSAHGVTVPQVFQQLSANNSNAGGGFYSQGGQFYYIRGLGHGEDDRGHRQHRAWRPTTASRPTSRTWPRSRSGSAVRLGQFGYMKQDDAVEGVILMRVGEQAQVVLKRVEDLTKELNEHVLPPDVKIVPYYDRSTLIEETTQTVERNLLRGMLLVLVILGTISVQRARGASSWPLPFRSP